MSVLISVVSHNQAGLVHSLLQDFNRYFYGKEIRVVLTINVEESLPFTEKDYEFKLKIIINRTPKGFSANHNTAFWSWPSDFFVVLNPDVRFTYDPISPLSTRLSEKDIGVIAPLVVKTDHSIEDNARRLPTPSRLIKRIMIPQKKSLLDYQIKSLIYPDWVAGIFMLFPSPVFAAMNGFDERFFLYFEDVDICSRLRLAGYKIVLDPSVKVIHDARRESHKNIKYFIWHVQSGLRFFSSKVFLNCLLRQKKIQ